MSCETLSRQEQRRWMLGTVSCHPQRTSNTSPRGSAVLLGASESSDLGDGDVCTDQVSTTVRSHMIDSLRQPLSGLTAEERRFRPQ